MQLKILYAQNYFLKTEKFDLNGNRNTKIYFNKKT